MGEMVVAGVAGGGGANCKDIPEMKETSLDV